MSNTVLIQRDERFQPNGIAVYKNIEATEAEIALHRTNVADDISEDAFFDALEIVTSCPESDAALAEGGGDSGYLPTCPASW